MKLFCTIITAASIICNVQSAGIDELTQMQQEYHNIFNEKCLEPFNGENYWTALSDFKEQRWHWRRWNEQQLLTRFWRSQMKKKQEEVKRFGAKLAKLLDRHREIKVKTPQNFQSKLSKKKLVDNLVNMIMNYQLYPSDFTVDA